MPYIVKIPKRKPIRNVNKQARQEIYRTSEWKQLRKAKLMSQPLCEVCLSKGIVTPAVDVHHKDSFLNYDGAERYAKAYDFNNLMSLCKLCHSELHRNGRTYG